MKTTNYKPGHVYLVSFGVAYKLGISTDHKTFGYRMTEYRMLWRNYFEKVHNTPAPAIVHMFPTENMRETEKSIQQRWRAFRWREIFGTEYYVLPATEVDWFCSLRPREL